MRYGKEINEQVVLRMLKEETTITEMSEELGVHYTAVRDLVSNIAKRMMNRFQEYQLIIVILKASMELLEMNALMLITLRS